MLPPPNGLKRGSEVNGLSKDVQKLLWKNKFSFPKADANLKSLGLLVCCSFFLSFSVFFILFSLFFLRKCHHSLSFLRFLLLSW